MASREIRDLSPAMQVLYNRFNDRCRRDQDLARAGVTVLLICTYRSDEEQEELYAQGRTKPGAIVTRAKPGKSKHNARLPTGEPAAEAFDVVPLRHGRPVWGTEGEDGELWQKVGAHGVAVGLKWYGSPDAAFREFPHFQNPDV
jgi:peptidoglycan L-alanyl-D-glutamate endopeptidase CwlK